MRELFGPKRKRGARRGVKGRGPLARALCALGELRGRQVGDGRNSQEKLVAINGVFCLNSAQLFFMG